MKRRQKKHFTLPFEQPLFTGRKFPSFLLGELKETISGDRWIWHQNDQDHLPSFPHLHGKNTSYKIDIYTGNVYDAKCKTIITKISKKDFKKIWTNKTFLAHVYEKRALYEQEFYDGVRYKALPEIPQF